MKNGDYILILAPKDFPGKLYRGKYGFEHRVIFWSAYGFLPEVVHHKNGNKHDNRLENLEGLTKAEHNHLHNKIPWVSMICPYCEKSFNRRPNYYRQGLKLRQRMYCSRSCSVLNQHRLGLVNLVGCNGLSSNR